MADPLSGARLRQALALAWRTRAEALDLKPRSKRREAAFMEWLSGVRIGILAQSGGLLDPDAKTELDQTMFFAQMKGESILGD